MDAKVTQIKSALMIARQVLDAFQCAARPHVAEEVLEAAVIQAAQGREIAFDLLTGPRTAEIEGKASGRILRQGDPLLLDLCLKEGEHWCDICRTFFLGEPTKQVKQAYSAVLGCFELITGMLGDQVKAHDLYLAAQRYMDQHDMAGWIKHHTGHGIGRTPFEAPVEKSGSEDILRTGDVVTVEIGVYLKGQFGIRVEDDYLITPNNDENLWNYPKALSDMMIEQDRME